jgi:hypothetical protein
MFQYADALKRAWPVFVEAARMGRTVSYTELAERAGPPITRRQVHRQLLKALGARCQAAGLPDLTALVVRKDTGLPGGGWLDPQRPGEPLDTWAEAVSSCFHYPWPPEPDPRLLGGSPTRRKPVQPEPTSAISVAERRSRKTSANQPDTRKRKRRRA